MSPGDNPHGRRMNLDTGSPTEESSPDIVTSSSKRKGRGRTRGLEVDRLVSQFGRLPVEIEPPNTMPVGTYAPQFRNEIGTIVRQFAPLQYNGWSKVPDSFKNTVVDRLKVRFDFLVNKVMSDYIKESAASTYSDFKSTMHGHYLKFDDPEEARNHPYDEIDEEDWQWLCDLWARTKFKQRSLTNSKNREKLPYNHKKGSEPFIRYQEKKRRQTGEMPTQIELFRDTHISKRSNAWINEEARSRYEHMLELHNASVEEGTPGRSDAEICEEVLGRRPRYTRGLGRGGPKPPPSRRNFNVDQDDHRKATESELDVTKSELEVIKIELETTKNSLQATQNSLEATKSSLAATNNKLDIFLRSIGYEIPSDK